MQFQGTEEQSMIREMVRDFAEEVLVGTAWEVGLGVDRNIALEGDHTVPEEGHTGLGEGRIDLGEDRKTAKQDN